MYIINWYESYRDLGRKLTEKKREVKRLEQENAELRQQRDKLLAVCKRAAFDLERNFNPFLERHNFHPATLMLEDLKTAIASVEAADAETD